MNYKEILTRSFGRHDQRRLVSYGALATSFAVSWCLCTVFNLYFVPLSMFSFRLASHEGLKSMTEFNKTSIPERTYVERNETMIICDTYKQSIKKCELNGDVRIQGNSSTIYVFSSTVREASWTIKPYARNGDKSAMKSVTNFTIKTISNTMPDCTQTHNVPAIVFSGGGYSANNFHAFTEIIIPLYATSQGFNRKVRFLLANKNNRWVTKFRVLLETLSRYEIIDIDHDNQVHCFPSMIVGLRKQEGKELYTDSIKGFTKFLRTSYSLERSTTIKLTNAPSRRPRLLIVSRQRTRTFTNVKDVVCAAQELGFEVVVTEMNANMSQVSKLVNSCDVMMGVHGAGLTNMVFLPENGVLIQVVPWGEMDWVAKHSFGVPSKEMGLNYLEYKISERESTLRDQYPLTHPVFMDPPAVGRKGWSAFKSIYLDKQNVTLDTARFKDRLTQALELLY